MTQWGGHFDKNLGSLPGDPVCAWSPSYGDTLHGVTLDIEYTNIIQLDDCTWQLTVACTGYGNPYIIWQGTKRGSPNSTPAGEYYRTSGCDTRRMVEIINCPPSFSSSEIPSIESSSDVPPQSSSSDVPPQSSSSDVPLQSSSSDVPLQSSSSDVPLQSSESLSESEYESISLSLPYWSASSGSADPDQSISIDPSDLSIGEECCPEEPNCLGVEGEMTSPCHSPDLWFDIAGGQICRKAPPIDNGVWYGTITLPPALVGWCDCPAGVVDVEMYCDDRVDEYIMTLHYCGKSIQAEGETLRCDCTFPAETAPFIQFNFKLWQDVGCDCVEWPGEMKLRVTNPCVYSSSSASSSFSSLSDENQSAGNGLQSEEQGGGAAYYLVDIDDNDETIINTLTPWFM